MKIQLNEVVLDTEIMIEVMKDRDLSTLKRYKKDLTKYIKDIQKDLDILNNEINERECN